MNFGIIQKLANCIVRPPRSNYTIEELGSPFMEYRNRIYQRDDFTVVNKRGISLQCSFLRDKFSSNARQTILFLHANSSCRLVLKNYVDVFLPYFDLLSFDFGGCGQSEGEYVTLGYNEREDVYSVLRQVRERYGVKNVVLWGRSMGAATGILYAAKYEGVKAMVCDNSFGDLEKLINQLSDEYIPFLPGFLLDSVIDSIQEHIEENIWPKQSTNFNVRKLKPISVIEKVNIPVFFIGSLQDSFVNIEHTKTLYKKATGIKHLELIKGDHNDLRTATLKQTVLKFLIQINTKGNISKERVSIFQGSHNSRGNSIKKQKIFKTPYCNSPDDKDKVRKRSSIDTSQDYFGEFNLKQKKNQEIEQKTSQQSYRKSQRATVRRRKIFQNIK